jgi:hypothetical protein
VLTPPITEVTPVYLIAMQTLELVGRFHSDPRKAASPQPFDTTPKKENSALKKMKKKNQEEELSSKLLKKIQLRHPKTIRFLSRQLYPMFTLPLAYRE